MKTLPNLCFHLMVVNTPIMAVHLLMNMEVPQLDKAQSKDVSVLEELQVDSVSATPNYNEKQIKEPQYAQHQLVTRNDKENKKSDWRDNLFLTGCTKITCSSLRT